MSQSPFLERGHWPLVHMENTSLQYFFRKYYAKHEDGHLFTRGEFLNALNTNPKFSEFWAVIQEQHPARKDYFLSLINEGRKFDSFWLRQEYLRYSHRKAFDELSEEDKRTLQNEFDKLRPAVYLDALKGEALRLNCDVSKVRPTSLVLLWKSDNDEESPLAKLPDDVFGRIMFELNTIDVFRMTLVCKRWKSLIHNNTKYLKRAEHALKTHLITFTDWMDPPKTLPCAIFQRQYQLFNWCLIRWYCGISNNLETLILHHPISYSNVTTLLQSCPNLKILQLGYKLACRDFHPSKMLPEKVHLPNLEVYLCTEGGLDGHSQQVKRDILCSVKRLRVLRASIQDGDMEDIQTVRPMEDIFHHLIALDLTCFSDNVLQMLATLPNLQLKYLRLDSCRDEYIYREHEYEIATTRYRDLFHQLLKRLRKLEVLETWFVPGVTNETIQLLIDLDLNLQFAVLGHSFVRLEPYHMYGMRRTPADPLDPNLLSKFRDRLLLRNPELDLSDFHFVFAKPELRDQLLAANIGFTFTCMRSFTSEDYVLSGLCYPAMRNRLNINF